MKKTVNAEAMGGVYIDLRLIVSIVSTHGIPYEQQFLKISFDIFKVSFISIKFILG